MIRTDHSLKMPSLILSAAMLTLLIFNLIVISSADAQGTIGEKVVIDGSKSVFIPEFITYRMDEEKAFSADEVISLPAESFNIRETDKSSSPAIGARWYRIPFENAGDQSLSLLIEISKPHLDNLLIVEANPEGAILHKFTLGRALPFYSRPIAHRNFIIPVTLESNEKRILYIRLETTSYIQLPIKFWQEDRFWENDTKVNTTLGIFYGITIAMILYNGFLSILLKSRAYLNYVLYLISFVLLQAVWDGFSYQYLWPNWPNWDMHANPVILSMVACTLMNFVSTFINLKESSKKFDSMLKAASAIFVALAVFSALANPVVSMKFVVPCLGLGVLLVLSVLIFTWKRKREYYYFVIGSSLVLLGASINLLSAWRIIGDNWFSINAPRMGISIEAIVLSFGLADTIQRIRREKRAAEKQKMLLQRLQHTTHRITAIHDPLTLINELNTGMRELIDTNAEVTIIRHDSHYIYQINDQNPCIAELDFGSLAQLPALLQARDVLGMTPVDEKTAAFFNLPCENIYILPIMQGENNEGFLLVSGNKMANAETKDILALFLEQIGIAVRNVRIMGTIRAMARTDALTGLMTRSAFFGEAEKKLEYFCRNKGELALLIIDIDQFKNINDSYGHDVGDKVIHLVATTLKSQTHGHLVGRFGGDEFMILTMDLKHDAVHAFAEKLRLAVQSIPLMEAGKAIYPTLSIGVSFLCNEKVSMNQLFKSADTALYLAKQEGRNRVVLRRGMENAI